MDDELRPQRICVTVHTIAAIIMGFLSPIIASAYRSLYAVILGIVVLFIAGFIAEKIIKEKKGVMWWFGNGGFIYLLVWVVVWILLYNL